MKWFGRRRPKEPIDPNAPHPFRPIDETALAAGGDALSSLGGRSSAAVLANWQDAARESHCHVRGCGRSPDDPIHI